MLQYIFEHWDWLKWVKIIGTLFAVGFVLKFTFKLGRYRLNPEDVVIIKGKKVRKAEAIARTAAEQQRATNERKFHERMDQVSDEQRLQRDREAERMKLEQTRPSGK